VKLLLDTNVLVAALIARGTCSDLLEHCVRQHVVVSSQALLNEREVLERKFSQRAIDVRTALQLFAETFTLVKPDPLDPPVCRDRDDDVVLATARAGLCTAGITGDQDLLILNPFRGIQVLMPSAFWKWEAEGGSEFRDAVDGLAARGSPADADGLPE
jgi:putative PIN family toxin of toxin-antitoxin system